MSYDFKNLSFADFEDLARDLIGKELGDDTLPGCSQLWFISSMDQSFEVFDLFLFLKFFPHIMKDVIHIQ